MTTEGVDYAFDKPTVQGLVDAGKKFACRYAGMGSAEKWLTKSEADSLAAAGIAIVAGVEGRSAGLLEGLPAGVLWASQAEKQYRAMGMPGDRPIYFAVDFDVTAEQWPDIADALRGAAGVIGAARVGIYGGRKAMLWARRDQVAAWFWQTYAWSAGKWVPGNHLEQYKNGVTIGGGDCDLDRALVPDYGQWKPGGNVAEKPIGEQVWEFVINSPSLKHKVSAADWLKQAYIAVQDTRAITAKLEEMAKDLAKAPPPSGGGGQVDSDEMTALAASCDDLRDRLDKVLAKDMIDPVAVAHALAADPTVVDKLAGAIAAKLGAISGEITLSGTLAAKPNAPGDS